jgi:hypothetical protein
VARYTDVMLVCGYGKSADKRKARAIKRPSKLVCWELWGSLE